MWYSRRYCMRGVAQAGGDDHGGGSASERGQAISAAGQDLLAGLRGLAVFPSQQARQQAEQIRVRVAARKAEQREEHVRPGQRQRERREEARRRDDGLVRGIVVVADEAADLLELADRGARERRRDGRRVQCTWRRIYRVPDIK